MFNRGVDLPDFASFPLVENTAGREQLTPYYDEYAAVARGPGPDSPWSAPPAGQPRLGREARVRRGRAGPGQRGGDRLPSAAQRAAGDKDHLLVRAWSGRAPTAISPASEDRGGAEYHAAQIGAFAAAGADLVAP